MVTTNNKDWAEKVQMYGLHGMSKGHGIGIQIKVLSTIKWSSWLQIQYDGHPGGAGYPSIKTREQISQDT